MWEGRYSSSGKVTLTVYPDMSGVFDFVNEGKSGRYKVSVEFSNGRYNVIGKEWIDRPSSYIFFNLNRGVINQNIFRGTDFQLERIANASQMQTLQAERERQLEAKRIEEEQIQAEQQKQLQIQQKKQEKERKIRSYIYSGIAFILFLIFLRLPKERQKAVLKVVKILVFFLLALVTLGIFRGIKNWENDR